MQFSVKGWGQRCSCMPLKLQISWIFKQKAAHAAMWADLKPFKYLFFFTIKKGSLITVAINSVPLACLNELASFSRVLYSIGALNCCSNDLRS